MRPSPALRRLAGLLLSSCTVAIVAEEPLDVDAYMAIVLRNHPAAALSAGLGQAARAERKAARLWPDPAFEYTRDRSPGDERPGTRTTEMGYALSQAIPWPGTLAAGRRAADQAATALEAQAEATRWALAAEARQAFAQLVAARALHALAQAAEDDARTLRDLVIRRADLGEAREADRIKATVEWLRQQRQRAAAEREAATAEAQVRALAVTPLPEPLAVSEPWLRPLAPSLDRTALVARAQKHSPRLRAARAEAARQQALLAQARQARVPDLGLSVFRRHEVDRRATGVALGLTLPLWNARRGEIARADAAMRLGQAEAERAQLDLQIELEARIKDVQAAGDQLALLEHELLPAATRSAALVRFAFEQGETSLLELLDAQRTWRDTQREAAEARRALSVAIGDVQKLVGPDFDPWR